MLSRLVGVVHQTFSVFCKGLLCPPMGLLAHL